MCVRACVYVFCVEWPTTPGGGTKIWMGTLKVGGLRLNVCGSNGCKKYMCVHVCMMDHHVCACVRV